MKYTVKKNVAGKHYVYYSCDRCQSDLESPIDEAGETFKCPNCSHSVTTPGTDELLRMRAAAEQRKQLLAEEQRKRKEEEAVIEEERSRAVAERRKVQRSRDEAETKRAAKLRDQEETERAREQLKNADRMSTADRLLALSFKIAKGISVLVVAASIAVVAVCLVMLVAVRPEKATTNVGTLAVPTMADYQEYRLSLMPVRATNMPDQASKETVNVHEQSASDRFDKILRRFDLFSFDRSLEFMKLDDESQSLLINGLEDLVKNNPNSVKANDVEWFINTFRSRWESINESKSARLREEERLEVAAATKRSQLIIIIGGALAGLLSFLFLPLLIQIEQNTRRVLAIEAATHKLSLARNPVDLSP